VTISFWHAMGGALGTTLTELIQKFHDENPGITVDLIHQGGYSALQQKLIAAVAAGEPPTLAQQYENWTTLWLDALVDLDLFLPEETLGSFLPQFDQLFEGRMVTVPFNKSILVLYYRPDLVPNPPTTWAELRAAAEALTTDDVYGYGFSGGSPGGLMFTMMPYAWANGGTGRRGRVAPAVSRTPAADCRSPRGWRR